MAIYHTDDASDYDSSIQLIEQAEYVLGGADGVDNRALKQLANRTAYFKKNKSNLFKGTSEPSASTVSTLELDSNNVNNTYYLKESTGSLYKLTAISPVTWVNISKDAVHNIKGVKINNAGNVNEYFYFKYDSDNDRLELVDESGNYANIRVGEAEFSIIDGQTATQTHIGDQETLLFFDITQESQNDDAFYGVKRLSDLSGTVTNVESDTALNGTASTTLDRFTVSNDLTGSLSAGDYIEIRGFTEDSGDEINGFYKVNSINSSYITTLQSFQAVSGEIDTGDTGLISKDVSVFLKWNETQQRFDCVYRNGTLVPINASSIQINGTPASPLADRTISTQTEFESYFGTNDGTTYYITDSEKNVYIKENTTGDPYELDHKVIITDSDISIVCLSGAKIIYTASTATIQTRNDSTMTIDEYSGNGVFEIVSENTQYSNDDSQISMTSGDSVYTFSDTHDSNKKYTISSIVKNVKEDVDIEYNGTGTYDNIDLGMDTDDYKMMDYQVSGESFRRIMIIYIDSGDVKIKGYKYNSTTNDYDTAFTTFTLNSGGTWANVRLDKNDDKFIFTASNGSNLQLFICEIADCDDGFAIGDFATYSSQSGEQIDGTSTIHTVEYELYFEDNDDLHLIGIDGTDLDYFYSNYNHTAQDQNYDAFTKTDLAVDTDSSNTTHIGFMINETSGEIIVTFNDTTLECFYYNGSSWSSQFTLDDDVSTGDTCGEFSKIIESGETGTGANDYYIAYNASENSDNDTIRFATIDTGETPSLSGKINTLQFNGAIFNSLDIKLNTDNLYTSSDTDLIQIIGYNTNDSWLNDTIDSTGTTGQYTSITIDSDNNIYISYYDASNNYLKYAKSTNKGISWTTGNVDISNDVGQYSSIAIDSDNNIYISYYDNTNNYLRYSKSTNGGSTWSSANIDTTNDVGQYSSIAIDSNNNIYVSYYDNTSNDLKYAKSINGGSTWSTNSVYTTNDSGLYSSITIDSNDYIYISFYEIDTRKLMYAKSINGGSTWSTGNIDTSLVNNIIPGSGLQSSIITDSNDYIYVSYYHEGNTELKYAKSINGGSSWSTAIIDTTNDVGQYNSITIDNNNYIYVSYYNNTSDDLKYAYSIDNASSWTTAFIDSTDAVGEYSSLAIDNNNHLFISYYDNTNDDLKFTSKLNSLYTAQSIDEGSTWSTNSIDLEEYDNSGSIVDCYNNYLFIEFFNDTSDTGDWDTSNQLLKIYYNFEISVSENIPTLGLTDLVLSHDFVDNLVLKLTIDCDSYGGGAEDSVVSLDNSTNGRHDIIIENSQYTNGIDGNDKTYNLEIKAYINESNDCTNNINELNHSFINGCDLITHNKNFNTCLNLTVIGLIDKTMEIGTGDYDA